MEQVTSYGYIPDTIAPEDYIFGGSDIPDEILQPDGQWIPYLPSDEFQFRGELDTYNCTGFATLNCIETLFKRKFGVDANYSERYVGVMAGTYPPGNSPHKVAETIRKESGVIDDAVLPFDDSIKTIDQYYAPKPMVERLVAIGKRFLDNYIFKHEWVFLDNHPDKIELMKEALKRSPLGVSVYAWLYDSDKQAYVKPKGTKDNHWVMIYGYDEGRYWFVFDQYDSTHKKLVWGYDFGQVKRYWIAKKIINDEVKRNSCWIQMRNKFADLISKLFPTLGRKLHSK